MIRSLGARATFLELRRSSDRARYGPLTVIRADTSGELIPGVAYSIPHQVGSAVQRNRLRRRLRALARELAAGSDPLLRPGNYLFALRPSITKLTFVGLRTCMTEALDQLDRLGRSSSSPEPR